MKKQIALLISILCLVASAYAQNEGEGELTQRPTTSRQGLGSGKSVGPGKGIEIKKKTYNFQLSVGPRIGGGLTMMSDGDEVKVSDGSGFGFDAGLGVNVRFGGMDSKGRRHLGGQGLIGVGLELNYASYSAKTVADKNLNLGYFEVPLLLQIYPAFQTKQLKNLYIEIGPTFSALVSKSPKELQTDPNTTYMTGNLKGGDVKGTVGVGYRMGKGANDGFYVNLRYNQGFSKLAGNFPCKISSAELTIGYLFKCVGGKGKGNTTNIKTNKRNVLR